MDSSSNSDDRPAPSSSRILSSTEMSDATGDLKFGFEQVNSPSHRQHAGSSAFEFSNGDTYYDDSLNPQDPFLVHSNGDMSYPMWTETDPRISGNSLEDMGLGHAASDAQLPSGLGYSSGNTLTGAKRKREKSDTPPSIPPSQTLNSPGSDVEVSSILLDSQEPPLTKEKGKEKETSGDNLKGKQREVVETDSAAPNDPETERSPPGPPPEPFSTYTCPICFSTPTNATATMCGHIFCGACLFTAVKTTIQRAGFAGVGGAEANTARCPVCRTVIPQWDGKGGGVIGLKPRAIFSF